MLLVLLFSAAWCRHRSSRRDHNDIFLRDDMHSKRYKGVHRSHRSPILPSDRNNADESHTTKLDARRMQKQATEKALKKFMKKDLAKKIRDYQQISLLNRFGIPKTALFGTRKDTRALSKFMVFLDKLKREGMTSPDAVLGLLDNHF